MRFEPGRSGSPMSESKEEKSRYGSGFIAACIVVGAILLCGAVLVISNLSSSHKPPAAQPLAVDSAAQPTGAERPAAQPTGTTASTGQRCKLPSGDQAVPTKAPVVDNWEISRHVAVPRSTIFGPATTDPDGFRRCFAHSPTGALYAAYSAIAAVADQRQAIPTARKLMLPGPDTDALIRELGREEPSGGSDPTQLAGYQFLAAGLDRVTVMLAIPVETAYMSVNLTLVWH